MSHQHNHTNQSTTNIRLAFFLNLGFAIIEIIGGFYTNSLAILSDALHDLGDSLSLGFAWYFQKLSEKGRSKTFSYGYKRFSLLGAIINAIILVVGSVLVLTIAIPRLLHPAATDAYGMMWLAILGVLVNGAAALRLRKGSSMNEQVVSLHLLEDVLGWVAVLIGSIVMQYTNAPFIDPLLSILIALFILYNTFRNLKKSMRIILQGIPEEINLGDIRSRIRELESVVDVHDCHVWSMDGEYNVLTVHVVLDKDYSLTEQTRLKTTISDQLKSDHIHHTTIAFEYKDEDCELEDC